MNIVPVWKAPVYNSPQQNWKRGMYAWSTAVFLVSLLTVPIQFNSWVFNYFAMTPIMAICIFYGFQ